MKRILITGAVLAVAVAGAGTGSAAPSVHKVTGGGQTLLGTTGAGNTIAFTAQSAGAEGTAAKGQFQLQNRELGNGRLKETVHGTITCVVVFSTTERGGMAVLGGLTRDGQPVRIDVIDNGEGRSSTDMIRLSRGAAAQDGGDDDEGDTSLCDVEDEAAETALGRGNVQVHKVRG